MNGFLEQTYFDLNSFKEFTSNDQTKYYKAQPFPHIIYDNLFDNSFLVKIICEIPDLHEPLWEIETLRQDQVKYRSKWSSEFDIPEMTLYAIRLFNSGYFMRCLSKLTGIDGLIPDLYFQGGGLNVIPSGSFLGIHRDGTKNDYMDVHRRLNVVLYLNPGWKASWGGNLRLVDKDNPNNKKSIVPAFNRLVIFTTNDYTLHGHPEPVCAPKMLNRLSLIQYYYTAKRPENELINGHHRAQFID